MEGSHRGVELAGVQKPELDVLYGPFRILPDDQLLSLVDGSGIETPRGRATMLGYSVEEVCLATDGIRKSDFYTDLSRFSHDRNRDYMALILNNRERSRREGATNEPIDCYRDLETEVEKLSLSEARSFSTRDRMGEDATKSLVFRSIPGQEKDGFSSEQSMFHSSTDSSKVHVEGLLSVASESLYQHVWPSARRPLPPLPPAESQVNRTLVEGQVNPEKSHVQEPSSRSYARVEKSSLPVLYQSVELYLQCPHEQAGYCRSWNIAHQNCCSYNHRFTYNSVIKNSSGYVLRKFVPGSPEFDYIKIRFVNSWIHPTVRTPKVTKVYQVSCPELEALFNDRKRQIELQTGNKANVTELYHGTCEAYFETIFTQGFLPPADYEPHPLCPVSGPYCDKLSTSLCNRDCNLCVSTPRHTWNMCHMWGLGIYCAMQSSKSDIYVSNKKGKKNDRSKRKMLICSVILGQSETVERLSHPDSMHERILPSRGKHSIYVIGSKNRVIPSTANGHKLAVVNDEYILFHSHQMLPLYIVEYSK